MACYFGYSIYKGFERTWRFSSWWYSGIRHILFGFYIGTSMSPARSLAAALLSGMFENLWLY